MTSSQLSRMWPVHCLLFVLPAVVLLLAATVQAVDVLMVIGGRYYDHARQTYIELATVEVSGDGDDDGDGDGDDDDDGDDDGDWRVVLPALVVSTVQCDCKYCSLKAVQYSVTAGSGAQSCLQFARPPGVQVSWSTAPPGGIVLVY